ncbi:hypothetical protein acdb102_17390 [Acidothermaceae bacterium B102]|nr:hypothetical protein acdb102_17390 [Acidothermaceae bacterium B102]
MKSTSFSRTYTVMSAAASLALLAGCSSGSSSPSAAASTAAATSAAAVASAAGPAAATTAAAATAAGATTGATKGKIKVALVLGLTDDPFMQEVSQGSKDAAAALGATLIVTGPPAPNPTVGINELAQVVKQGIAGVTIFPLPSSLWSKAISSAAASTKVNITNDVAAQGIPGSETYIGNNTAEASRMLIDGIISKLPANPSGEIVLGSCIPGVSSLDIRIKTYQSYLKQKLPNVKIVGPITTTTDPAKNLGAWTNAFNAHSKALAYIGNCDSDGPSLVRLRQQHPGTYASGTFDVNPSTLTGLRDGDMSYAVDEEPYARGYIATSLLIMQAQGKPAITGFINIKGALIGKDNAASVITREATPATRKAGFDAAVKAYLASPQATTGDILLEPIARAYEE